MKTLNWNEILIPYEQAVDEMVVKFRNLDQSYRRMNLASPIEQVKGRVKKVSSILTKAKRKNIPLDEIESGIEDIAGIRIITRFVEDIDKVVQIIRSRHLVDLEILAERNYVTTPKSSGYRSYHVIVKYPVISAQGYKEVTVEIQIRTLAMNFWATIEHGLRYKYQESFPDNLEKRLIRCAEAAYALDAEMSEIYEEAKQIQNGQSMNERIVDDVLNKIQLLYTAGLLDEATEMNREFTQLYDRGDTESLIELNKQLSLLTDLYGVG